MDDESTWKVCEACGDVLDETELTYVNLIGPIVKEPTFFDLVGHYSCKKCLKPTYEGAKG